jgi:hypothetical protein
MQGRFKMEYRLFTITIVRYNYGYYNTPSITSEIPGETQDDKKKLKNLKPSISTGENLARKS